MTEPRVPAEQLEAIAEEHRDLRPVVDVDMDMVLADCPECHAQDSDPLGLWRPLQIIPRAQRTILECTACGAHREFPT